MILFLIHMPTLKSVTGSIIVDGVNTITTFRWQIWVVFDKLVKMEDLFCETDE